MNSPRQLALEVFGRLALCALWLAAVGLAAGGLASASADDHADLSYFHAPDGTRRPVRSTTDWEVRRKQILAGMQEAMGRLRDPSSLPPPDVIELESTQVDGLIRRKISYVTDRPERRVHAWLLTPANAKTPAPAALCLHQTTERGKDQPMGLVDRPTLHYGLELARRGYVTLAPDYPSFGEYDYKFEGDGFASGSMKAILDNRRALDVLESLAEVDTTRLACIGHSLGGHNGLFTAAIDPRIRAVATSCGFTAFARYMGGDLTGWTSLRYMPRIATRFDKAPARMPFDFHEVLAAIAPRGVFISAPTADDNFDVVGVRETIRAAEPIFALYGRRENLQAVFPECGHEFPDASRTAAYEFLDRVLQVQRSN